MSNQYSFRVPTALLSQIANTTFRLPFYSDTNTPNNVEFSSSSLLQDSVSSITSPSITTSATQTTTFLPSHNEIQLQCSTNSPFDDVTLNHSFTLSEFLDTFGDETQARLYISYLTSDVYLISQQTSVL